MDEPIIFSQPKNNVRTEIEELKPEIYERVLKNVNFRMISDIIIKIKNTSKSPGIYTWAYPWPRGGVNKIFF